MAEQPLWTSSEIMAATGGRAKGPFHARGVAIDSREVQKGDLFVALLAARDGHEFVHAAMRAGAAGCLLSQAGHDVPHVKVADTLEALRALGEAARARCNARRVAVTGSVGKTSVKQALADIFHAAGRGHASIRSFNNHWGVPLTLARMPRDTERAVFEIGMNHAGEIRDLVGLVQPHIAVITRIGTAHLENFADGRDGIAAAKAEIFEGLAPWGAAIIPGEDDYATFLAERAGIAGAGWLIRFGRERQDEARLLAISQDPASGRPVLEADILGRKLTARLPDAAPHWINNFLAVAAAAHLCDVPMDIIAETLSRYEVPEGRGRRITVPWGDGQITVLDDSYNANPTSMRAALEILASQPGRRVAFLGEMRELGPQSAQFHREMAVCANQLGIDCVHVVGEAGEALHETLDVARRGAFAAHVDTLTDQLETLLEAGDTVLFKGSNAVGMARLVAAVKARGGAA